MQVNKISWVFLAMAVSVPMAWGQRLGSEPFHDAGQSITGAFEGWFPNPDGTFSIMVGYFNRNSKQVLAIPIGPNNHIDPGGPDHGQPTHFLPNRGWGVFTITVPKDFGTNEFTWTIVANGQPTVIPLNLKDLWQISPFVDAVGNTPPYLRFQSFDEDGPMIQGPKPLVISRTATVGVPLPLPVWVADDVVLSPGRLAPKNPITLSWNLLRGPTDVKDPVTFSDPKPKVEKIELKDMPKGAKFDDTATTSATFNAPGDYVLYLAVNDASGTGGGGGFQCCWTNGHVHVTVKAAPGQ